MPARLPHLLLLAVLLPGCNGLFEEKDDDDDDWDDDDGAEVDTGPSGSGGGSGSGDGGSGSGSGDGGSGSGDGGSGSGSEAQAIGGDGTGDDGGDVGVHHRRGPDYGTTAEARRSPSGALRRLRGGFAGGERATIQSVTEDRIEVIAPAVAAAGPVDVDVESDIGAGQVAGGFTYWADATSQYGALGLVSFTEQVGSYWSSTPGPGEDRRWSTSPSPPGPRGSRLAPSSTLAKEGVVLPSFTISTIDPG